MIISNLSELDEEQLKKIHFKHIFLLQQHSFFRNYIFLILIFGNIHLFKDIRAFSYT
jgi:hypothetical protein